jgi:hypothetical protein
MNSTMIITAMTSFCFIFACCGFCASLAVAPAGWATGWLVLVSPRLYNRRQRGDGCGSFESDDDGVVSGRGSGCGRLSNVSWEKLGCEVRRGRKAHSRGKQLAVAGLGSRCASSKYTQSQSVGRIRDAVVYRR